MTLPRTDILTVSLASDTKLTIGRLARHNRNMLFEYDQSFLASGIALSPFHLPTDAVLHTGDRHIFDGLFGLFNDSLPDGWGRLLLDRALAKHGIPPHTLTPLDRLACVGPSGMGALIYEPADHSTADAHPALDLDTLATQAAAILSDTNETGLEHLLQLAGASAGARPKILAQVGADRSNVRHSPQPLPPGYAHWIIKFPATLDSADIGRVEYAYSLMARDAGLTMPDTHLFGPKQTYFGIQRFDRDGDRRIHMHSLSGLLHADHRTDALDYHALLQATHVLTKDVAQLTAAFRLACFNVLSHNRDDHAKNVSFLMDTHGRWTLSPAYDLTFSSGPNGEQTMSVAGESSNPGIDHLRKLAANHPISRPDIVIDQVNTAIARWPTYAEEARVSKATAKQIATVLLPDTHQLSPSVSSRKRSKSRR